MDKQQFHELVGALLQAKHYSLRAVTDAIYDAVAASQSADEGLAGVAARLRKELT
jgi:hypothetical protein